MILVDVEIEWMHNRLAPMIKESRRLLEVVFPSVFSFLAPTINYHDGHLILTRIKDALLGNKVVRASIEGLKIDPFDKKWIKDELPNFLHIVIDIRNYFDKEQHLPGKQRDKNLEMIRNAVSIHGEMLGIGCIGVLPRLMKIKKATTSKK